jgi:hypothetical protein
MFDESVFVFMLQFDSMTFQVFWQCKLGNSPSVLCAVFTEGRGGEGEVEDWD